MKRIILYILCIIAVLSCSKENGFVSTNSQYSRGKTEYFFDGEKYMRQQVHIHLMTILTLKL